MPTADSSPEDTTRGTENPEPGSGATATAAPTSGTTTSGTTTSGTAGSGSDAGRSSGHPRRRRRRGRRGRRGRRAAGEVALTAGLYPGLVEPVSLMPALVDPLAGIREQFSLMDLGLGAALAPPLPIAAVPGPTAAIKAAAVWSAPQFLPAGIGAALTGRSQAVESTVSTLRMIGLQASGIVPPPAVAPPAGFVDVAGFLDATAGISAAFSRLQVLPALNGLGFAGLGGILDATDPVAVTLAELGRRVQGALDADQDTQFDAYVAVEQARAAVLRGDDDAVRWFMRTWLRVPWSDPTTRAFAVGDALLEIDPSGFGPGDGLALLQQIRTVSGTRFEGRQLLGEQKRNYRYVTSLDALAARLADGRDRTEALYRQPGAGFRDPRLVLLIERLEPREIAVLEAKADAVTTVRGQSWADAAITCGLEPREGERIRAKVQRLRTRILAAGVPSSLVVPR